MNYQILLFSLLLMQTLTKRPYLTCSDVALLGFWDTGMCCGACHGDEGLIHDSIPGHQCLLCCHCSSVLSGERMPNHEDVC